ncbi:hypothetical protein EVJ58_g7649 [Rhodofomes roseus]|nr:hypothetical protein EVJ58_g7649 [Rhodofomes roseus]
MTSFRFSGRRVHHNAPSRGSRRLADKVAAVEKEGKTPAAKIELLRRIAQDEYNDVAHGRELKAAMRCEDLPSYEFTRTCELGLVLFPPPGMMLRENSVEVKSEPDELDFLRNDNDSTRRRDDTVPQDKATLERHQAVRLGQQGEASHSGAAGSSALVDGTGGKFADGDVGSVGVDGEPHLNASAHVAEESSPLPGWEVLHSASRSKPTDEDAVNALL